MARLFFLHLFFLSCAQAATIAIIDTGFDLDHEFLRPKILKQETDEEQIDPKLLKKFHGWNFHDNSHLKRAVVEDQSEFQEILLFRNLRAKGHQEGLTPEEFEWYTRKSADTMFMSKVKKFKKHAHGTIVAGIALREGENINIFPIRGLHIPVPVVAVENAQSESTGPIKGKTPLEKYKEEIANSLNRVSKKFSKICNYLSLKKIEVVNASYGITYKNIVTTFRENHRQYLGREIEDKVLEKEVNEYFEELYRRGEKTMRRYPNMLFVFSAGNSGLDNNQFHHYPSRIKIPNAITVAATNGEYLASFSNYGTQKVDIGAPGVAILSLIPKVYSQDGQDIYSPSSGTSMAAPYVSNLAAQIMNNNPRLKVHEVKRIIMETGDQKEHLKNKLLSGAIVNNHQALKAALLSQDFPLDEAINLSKSNLVPVEDKISIGLPPAIATEDMKKKIMGSVPQYVAPAELDEEGEEKITKSSSSSKKGQGKGPQDNLVPQISAPLDVLEKSSDPVPSNQNEVQSPQLFEGSPASSSEPRPIHPEIQSPDPAPSLPQS